LTDARWNERLAIVILMVGIVAIGVAPFWLNDLIAPGAESIMRKVMSLTWK
jgi:NADH-quinone oxidoreductase subunit M